MSKLPLEYSQDILGVGCPFAEHGSNKAAPADTDVFCERQTHVGNSVWINYLSVKIVTYVGSKYKSFPIYIIEVQEVN